MHLPQRRQLSMRSMRSCHSGVSQSAEGARRIIWLMRAQLLICIPCGQGMQ